MTKTENKLHRLSIRIPLHQVNILEREQVNQGQSYSKTIRTLIDKHQENI